MIEKLGLIIILILASIYVFRHVRRTLTVGEDDKNCQNCPATNVQPLETITSVKKPSPRINANL
jgi:hypothetical protein